MVALRIASIVLALAGQAGAARVKAHAKAQWLTHRQRWCLSQEAAPVCDGKTIIDIKNAFLAAEWKDKCEPFTPTGPGSTCDVDVTAGVQQLCQGKVSCSVPPSFYSAACAEMASMRIIWDCVAGGPETAQEDTQHKPPLPKELSEDTAKEIQAAVPQEISAEAAKKLEKAAEELKASHEEVAELKPVSAAPEKARDAAVELVEKAKKEPSHELLFNPCYRHTRWDLISTGKIFDRLTSCPSNEGCFKLHWLDGKTFEDPEHPPTATDIAAATLKKGEDSLTLSFFSIGLERNDYDTWGVCLPKEQGVDFATAVFNTLKKR